MSKIPLFLDITLLFCTEINQECLGFRDFDFKNIIFNKIKILYIRKMWQFKQILFPKNIKKKFSFSLFY